MNTIIDWIESVLGNYQPITYQVKESVADALGGVHSVTYNAIPSGLAGVDWRYVSTAAFLLVCVWSVFRLLGVLLSALSGGRRV